jgi:hypothetical protein
VRSRFSGWCPMSLRDAAMTPKPGRDRKRLASLVPDPRPQEAYMTYTSRIDWCVVASILLTVGAIGMGASYWIGGPVMLVLLLCAYPKSYKTAVGGLIVRDALSRREIPYAAITYAAKEKWGLRIRFGLASEMVIIPANPDGLLADVEAHAVHLARRNGKLVLRDRHIEYSFTKPRRVYGIGQ